MDASKVDMYLASNGKFFPPEKLLLLKEKLSMADDSKLTIISSVQLKDPTTILIISIFLGYLGVDRFMIGDTGIGILKFLTGGCCGILTIIDWFSIQNKAKEVNFQQVISLL